MIFYILSVTIFGLCVAKELPIPLTTCERNSVDYSSCLIDAAQKSWLQIVKGFPEIDFPGLDPLPFDHFDIKYNNNMIHAEINLSDLSVKGLKEMRFLSVKPYFNEDAFHLVVDVMVPKEHGIGNLKVNIRLGTWIIGGEGRFDMSRGFRATWNITGHVKDDTLIVEHFYVPALSSENMQVNLDNLIDNDLIKDLLGTFIKRYGNELSQAMIPIEMIFMEPVLINLLNQLFSKISFSAVFP